MSFLPASTTSSFVAPLLHLELVEARPEDLHADLPVLDLAALVLAGDDDARRHVREAHGRIGHVDVLPARSARPVGVDTQVLVLYLDLDVVLDLRPGEHRSKRGLTPRVGVEGADAHEPVDPRLGGKVAEGVFPLHENRGTLDPRLLAGLQVGDVALVPPSVTPPQVHAQQHLGPVLAVRAAGAGVDREDGVGTIMLTAEHLLKFGTLDGLPKGRETEAKVTVDALPRVAPLEEDPDVILLRSQERQDLEIPFDPLAAALHLLGARLVLPEGGRGHPLLEPRALGRQRISVKDSRGCPRPSRRDHRMPAAGRRSSRPPKTGDSDRSVADAQARPSDQECAPRDGGLRKRVVRRASLVRSRARPG